jgi:hypothetical protein
MSNNIQSISQILQSMSSASSSGVMQSFWDEITDERKTKFENDPLACAIGYYRLHGEYGILHTGELLIQEDYIESNRIKEYYSKKYFWQGLKSDRPVSDFRSSLLKLIAINENWELTDKETGLFVKLPAFYKEDQFYDSLIKSCKTDKKFYSGTVSTEKVETLDFLGQTFRWQGRKSTTYWFKSTERRLYGYTTAYNHPFNALFEELIKKPQTFNFSCGVDNISNMWYNSIKSFSILKEQNA